NSVPVSDAATGFEVRVTATPARHGPEGIEPVTGDVIGFVLEWEGATNDALYVSGDTVWYEGVAQIGERFGRIGTAVLFLGGVRPAEGEPLLTMDAAGAVQTMRTLSIKTVMPVHYEGWQHFIESRTVAEQVFAKAGLDSRIVWLTPGEAQSVAV
ncbi:MAG: MBL fold metallo-hydrolase, partial [Cytophagales bacterium]|nr:MBL fold metallo-hydrolase [Armatimonadota bacterium]